MKKIMVLFMLSVFFLTGGIVESIAQKNKKDVVEKTSVLSYDITAYLGEFVRMVFNMHSLDLPDVNDVSDVSVFVQKPDGRLIWILILNMEGKIIHRNPNVGDRITAV